MTELKEKIDKFIIFLSVTNTKSRKQLSEAIQDLNSTINKLDLIDTFRTLYPRTAVFLTTHGTLIQTGHMLGHKASLNKFQRIKIIWSIFSDHCGIKLEINSGKIILKSPNVCKLNSILLNNHGMNKT